MNIEDVQKKVQTIWTRLFAQLLFTQEHHRERFSTGDALSQLKLQWRGCWWNLYLEHAGGSMRFRSYAVEIVMFSLQHVEIRR